MLASLDKPAAEHESPAQKNHIGDGRDTLFLEVAPINSVRYSGARSRHDSVGPDADADQIANLAHDSNAIEEHYQQHDFDRRDVNLNSVPTEPR